MASGVDGLGGAATPEHVRPLRARARNAGYKVNRAAADHTPIQSLPMVKDGLNKATT